jgi:hypothetical protein
VRQDETAPAITIRPVSGAIAAYADGAPENSRVLRAQILLQFPQSLSSAKAFHLAYSSGAIRQYRRGPI